MPKDIESPFTPGRPVPVELFVGRSEEIGQLIARAASASRGKLQVGFIIGERGIGKSSLASFVRVLAEKEHRMLGLHILLGGVSTLEEMARRVFDRLVKESIEKPWYKKISDFLGKHIRKVGLFDISFEFSASHDDLSRAVHDFAPAMHNLIRQLGGDRKGIVLILDDINGLAVLPAFANWLKSLVDEIATSQQGKLPLYLLLVGTEERRQALIQSQPSAARLFDLMEIKAWSQEESSEFLLKAFETVGVVVEDRALDLLSQYSGGLPVLAHELGDAAFRVDADGVLDFSDAHVAVLRAADIVGNRYLQPQVLQAIRSKRYHSILRKLAADPLASQFTRRDALKLLSKDEEKVFDNFLGKMRQLGVLVSDSSDRGPGAYRFPNLLHRLYFALESQRAKGGFQS
jgi:AAA+ ATPase superfamily predicted ATPase